MVDLIEDARGYPERERKAQGAPRKIPQSAAAVCAPLESREQSAG